MRAPLTRPLLFSLAIIVAAGLFSIFISSPPFAYSSNATAINGYAWSDTTGWISMSGTNYGLSMDASGNVTGYAWSDSIGWISANSADIAACQSGATSKVQSGTWTGWLRSLSGGTTGSGGWDGCISMSGSGYGVTYNASSGAFGGYAWGDTNVGWVDFSQVSTAASCQNLQGDNYCNGNSIYQHDVQGNACLISTCTYGCQSGECVPPPSPQGAFSDGSALQLTPSIVPKDQTINVSWSIENVQGTCSVVGTNGDSWQSNADGSGNSAGSQTSSVITQQTIYTLTCTGIDSSHYTESHTVNVIPAFREI